MAAWLSKLLGAILSSKVVQTILRVFSQYTVYYAINLAFRGLRDLDGLNAIGQLKVNDGDFQALIDAQLTRGDISQTSHDMLQSAYNDLTGAAGVTKPIATALFLQQYFKILTANADAAIEQTYADRIRGKLPDPDTVIPSLRFGKDTPVGVVDLLQRAGFSDADITNLTQAQRVPLDTASVLQLLLNGTIDYTGAMARLQSYGLSEADAEMYLQSTPGAPLPDIFASLLTGASIDDNVAAELGLDNNIPPRLVEWLTKNGLPASLAPYFWRAHYQLPTIDILYNAIARGFVDPSISSTYYKALNLPESLWPILDQMRTQPIDMLQAAQALQANIIGETQFRSICKANGFSYSDTDILYNVAQSTLNSNVTSQTIQAIQYAISDGFMSDADATAMFVSIGFTESQAQMQVALAHYQAEYQYAQTALASIEKGFETAKITDNEAVTDIIALGILPAKAQDYINLWSQKAKLSASTPTNTDVQKMLKYKIIDETAAVQYLVLNGYNATDAARLAALMIAENGG